MELTIPKTQQQIIFQNRKYNVWYQLAFSKHMLSIFYSFITIYKYSINKQTNKIRLPCKVQLSPWQAFVSFFLQEMEYFNFTIIKMGTQKKSNCCGSHSFYLQNTPEQGSPIPLSPCDFSGSEFWSMSYGQYYYFWGRAFSFPLGHQDQQF